jgi:hypothetical protein
MLATLSYVVMGFLAAFGAGVVYARLENNVATPSVGLNRYLMLALLLFIVLATFVRQALLVTSETGFILFFFASLLGAIGGLSETRDQLQEERRLRGLPPYVDPSPRSGPSGE